MSSLTFAVIVAEPCFNPLTEILSAALVTSTTVSSLLIISYSEFVLTGISTVWPTITCLLSS